LTAAQLAHLSNDTPARLPGDDPGFPAGGPDPSAAFPTYVPRYPRPKFQHKVWKHLVLFLLTVLTTTFVGAEHYGAFASDFGRRQLPDLWTLVPLGLWYSGTLLLILGAHEFGHYAYCRYYNVDATLPYFIPAPLPLTGTLGAVIRIRETFPNRAVLFDIGVAGPIGGFIVLVPALFIGMGMSEITAAPTEGHLLSLGEPLLFQVAARLVFGVLTDGQTINMHPMVFAAWFGMLATALNLLPFGQLDGGHITYATLRRYSTPVSILTVTAAVVMTFISSSWLFMTAMMVAMLALLGPRHPQVINEYEPLGVGRYAVALFALVMLILCFTPVPIEPLDLIRNP
jgi:membrane-associated protease RseP (regulator of RpoE activity)